MNCDVLQFIPESEHGSNCRRNAGGTTEITTRTVLQRGHYTRVSCNSYIYFPTEHGFKGMPGCASPRSRPHRRHRVTKRDSLLLKAIALPGSPAPDRGIGCRGVCPSDLKINKLTSDWGKCPAARILQVNGRLTLRPSPPEDIADCAGNVPRRVKRR